MKTSYKRGVEEDSPTREWVSNAKKLCPEPDQPKPKLEGGSPSSNSVSNAKKHHPEPQPQQEVVTDVKTLVEDNRHNETEPKPHVGGSPLSLWESNAKKHHREPLPKRKNKVVNIVTTIVEENEHCTRERVEWTFEDGTCSELYVYTAHDGPID